MRINNNPVCFAIAVSSILGTALCFLPTVTHIGRLRSLSCDTRADIAQVSATAEILAPKIVDAAQVWLFQEPLARVIPRKSLSSAIKELQASTEFWDTNKSLYEKWWLQFENTVREETRSLREILGNEAVNELLITVEKADVYDPTIVTTFLSNPAFESMIGGILYEGIFEFIQRVDIIGNVVNKLPIIGPIRQTIMTEFKKNLDKTLGGQVKTFLSSFNRIAVQRMIEFILSPSNRLSLQRANRNVVQSILERPFASVVPSTQMTTMLRDQIWSVLRETPSSESTSIGTLNGAAFF